MQALELRLQSEVFSRGITSMAKKAAQQEKAVKKIRKAIRKAVDKDVNVNLIAATVEDAMGDSGESGVNVKATAKVARMPSGNKQTDVTLKRGVTAPSAKKVLNKKPLKPDSEKSSLKKLPGKRKPPTLTLTRGEEFEELTKSRNIN